MDDDDDDYSSTSTSSPSFKFRSDVFVSFKGKDTRHNFIERLYIELERKGIRTFRYDDELEREEEISPILLTAIEDLAISIAVISKNYASSPRCLEELAKILECRRLILPVFFEVDPSHIGRQEGQFEEGFRILEQRFGEEKVVRWRKAMEKAGRIFGRDSKNWYYISLHPFIFRSGNTCVEELMRILYVTSNGVQIVGFHGMGGIGKTTLAKALYNKVVVQFEHRSFISNIRETSRQRNGLISLQNKLIRDLFPNNVSTVNEVNKGIVLIREKIHEVRVLVVLDDVDDASQLDALAGRRNWFYEGSRIIITTRDIKVLMNPFVNEVYEVKQLNSSDSLHLFSYHAFGREKPTEAFMHLSEQIISLTKGLPLALEVFGAFLFDKRRIKEWEDALEKLKQIRPGSLQEVLKISYDGLNEQEKCIFLDIACFFVKMDMMRDYAIDIFKGCGFKAEMAFTVLTAKSLIRVIDNNTLWMHDQLRDMGRQIVPEESIGDLGKRSRLWDHEEIMKVLNDEMGTKSIQGIIFDFKENSKKVTSTEQISEVTLQRWPNFTSTTSYLKEMFKNFSHCQAEEEKEVKLCTKPFEPMKSLRLLQINHVNLEGKFELVPAKLKWLQWKGCPLEALPSDFCSPELAILDLSESKIKSVWGQRWRDGYKVGISQMAERLMVMNLHGCYNLNVTPDLSGSQVLEKLILERCTGLLEIHKSIGDVRSLLHLNLKDCSNLMELPDDISGLRHLENLILSGCSKLKELPKDLGSMESLRELLVDGTSIVTLPDSISCLKKLERLGLNGCQSLRQLPISIGKLGSLRELSLNGSALEELPDSIGSLKDLKFLSFRRCESLDVIPDSIGKLESLLELLLDGCPIKELPVTIGSLSHLKHLSVASCRFLCKLPNSIRGLTSLLELCLDRTPITELPDQIGTLNMLEKLEMRKCDMLRCLPDSIGNMLSLTTFILDNAIIKELPESIGLLEKLEIFIGNNCKQLSRLPASIGKLKCLQKFLIVESGVTELPGEFGMLLSLKELKMGKRPHLDRPKNRGGHSGLTVLSADENPKHTVSPTSFSSLSLLRILDARSCKISGIIPDDFEKLSSLETLELDHNNFCSLPSSLRGLSVLKKLSFLNCIELKSLPPLPSSLIHVDVTHCSALESISDLSNLESLEELRMTNCKQVMDIPGLECLKSLKSCTLKPNGKSMGGMKTSLESFRAFPGRKPDGEMDDEDCSSTSTSSPSFKFRSDVFVSFRGEDTRHNFIDRLYIELELKGIRSFRYNGELEMGEEISPTLLTAIEDSATSIAVISKNYASSPRCLEELAGILEFRRLILPVFFEVDPSHVRHQKGPFEEGFRILEQRFGEEKVVRWREAMKKAGGISGWDSKNWSESELIQSLVKTILIKLRNIPLAVAKHPIGINTRVEELMRILDVRSNGVRIVGFHGMGGIGKTTLAKAIYNKIVVQFEHRSFISNIREISRQRNGLISLQNKIIRDLFPNNVSIVDDVNRGIVLIREKIHEKRVLVVLDDVDDASQLDALAGRGDWFYEGSRIIITTRDIEVLLSMKTFVNKIYKVKELNSSDSLQLFCYHAFGREKPTEAFMHLSEQIVSLTQGLPLALEVFGAFLFDKRRPKEWEDSLEKLKQIRPGNLQGVLKISFDGLNEQEKCIFLDIACFFYKMDTMKDYAIDIFKGCGFKAEIAFTVLTAKSLIRIIDNNTLWMHDQLRDMGRQIVREESIGDLGKRSRLWVHDEIMKVLKDETGTKSIQGIIVDFEENSRKEMSKNFSDCEAEQEKEVKLCTKPFEPMKSLRLLQINHVNLEGKFELVPAKLKWLQWKGCPLEALPSDFCPQELAVLDLSESKIKTVWGQRWRDGYKLGIGQMAERLLVMNLHGCCNLTVTPDLSGSRVLEKLILERCTGLLEIHKSIRDVHSLLHLNLKGCSNIMEFPDDISGLRHLENLILSGCSKLKELPKDLGSMESLRELLIDGTSIVKLPDSISCLKKLERLSLNDCLSLQNLPISIGKLGSLRELSLNGSALEELPDSIVSLKDLEILSFMRCGSLDVIPDSIGELESLLELLLDGCPIKELPATIGTLSHLKHLSVDRCRFLSKLPDSIGGLTSLLKLQLNSTPIAELPDQIGTLKMLEKLEMRNCEMLRCLPDSIGNMLSLTTFILENAIIEELPESIGLLGKLEIFSVNDCKQLSRLPASFGKLKCLQQFLMVGSGVAELPGEFGMLSNLKELKMGKNPYLERLQNMGEQSGLTVLSAEENPMHTVSPTSFSSLSLLQILVARSCKISGIIPDEFEKLSSLETLELGHNNFCSLPSSLRGLSILKKLSLPNCIELKSLPPLPSSLIHVDVSNCTALEIISDLSNLEYLQELRLTNCKQVMDIPGLECLKSLESEILEHWLYPIVLWLQNSLGILYKHTHTQMGFVSNDMVQLQVTLKHLRNLSVPGREIPDWFIQEVPSFSSRKNHDIKGVIICVVISLDQQKQDDFRDRVPAIVDIQAKILRENLPIFTTTLYLLGVPKTNEDQIYLCRYLDFNTLVFMLKDGDKIQVTMRNPPRFSGLELKKYGIHLVFEDDDDTDDDEQSISEKLAKFFSCSDGVCSSDSGSGEDKNVTPEH
ncbi:hypothetical protein HHK36_007134 [Tetracentron sinense]|uniref:TIR domain-containing protein n=1 Tax=Tetracentron sinense TaxID=13715 RepID=A0A834ZIQ8_TETSI|nr:hypothetical protein HHK36_007134 [Tetracentron sinense]